MPVRFNFFSFRRKNKVLANFFQYVNLIAAAISPFLNRSTNPAVSVFKIEASILKTETAGLVDRFKKGEIAAAIRLTYWKKLASTLFFLRKEKKLKRTGN